jgi:hypothetical protein
MNAWTNFFLTAAGASAALAGLVIVAVSVNISRILSFPPLPARAAAAIATLVLILVTSMAGLIPQSMESFGMEVLLFGVSCWLLQVWDGRHMLRAHKEWKRPWYEALVGLTMGQVQTLPFLIAGVLLAASDAVGLYWMAGGVIAIFVFSMVNAWVLLVEILR